MNRTISDIKKKLAAGEAVVMTASELCGAVRSGKRVSFADVDIVTAATCGLMSGTYAVLSFQVAEPNAFVKASRLFLNGVEAFPGPCPNERLGLVDTIVYGTTHSRNDPRYGGGHLFRDLAAGKSIHVALQTESGRHIEKEVTIDEMPHAVLHASRHAFRNYVGFVNPGSEAVSTIFCSRPLPPHLQGATACGCGEINPLQKDPELRAIGLGTRVQINGGIGYVLGHGTRCSPQRPNLSAMADMHGMNPGYMGGFQTSAGPEVIQTWAVPIAIIDEKVLETSKTLDEQIPLSVTDINGRAIIAEGTYADLWANASSIVSFDASACLTRKDRCPDCPPMRLCPSGAFGGARIDPRKCFHCGICASSCYHGCFVGRLGSVRVMGKDVPFIQRLSDRPTAMAAAAELKKRILSGAFEVTEPVAPITL